MEFIAWPKTPRLFRTITVSEKIDGTNACIIFEQDNGYGYDPLSEIDRLIVDDVPYLVGAQSRNRMIVPGKNSDNAGFAQWVLDNEEDLFQLLGPGRHYGEWWGKGIARKYDMGHKVFSVFNTDRWGDKGNVQVGDAVINSVPVLYRGEFSERAIQECLYDLQKLGSQASPGFDKAEGVVVFHHMSRRVYKVTLDNEDKGKWEVME